MSLLWHASERKTIRSRAKDMTAHVRMQKNLRGCFTSLMDDMQPYRIDTGFECRRFRDVYCVSGAFL